MEWRRPDPRLTIHPGTVDDDDEKKTCFRVRRGPGAETGFGMNALMIYCDRPAVTLEVPVSWVDASSPPSD